jgi:hypothetical protein
LKDGQRGHALARFNLRQIALVDVAGPSEAFLSELGFLAQGADPCAKLTGIYQQYKDRLAGIVEIPEFNPKTTGLDLADLLKTKRAFREAIADPSIPLMSRQRLKMAQPELYACIETAGLL